MSVNRRSFSVLHFLRSFWAYRQRRASRREIEREVAYCLDSPADVFHAFALIEPHPDYSENEDTLANHRAEVWGMVEKNIRNGRRFDSLDDRVTGLVKGVRSLHPFRTQTH